MNPNDIILLGLKRRVTAIARNDGEQIWSTELSGSMGGGGFVTLICDGELIFAHSAGHLNCLELATGRLLWTNELAGFGYGLASLCLPYGNSVPDAAIVEQMRADDSSSTAGASHPPAGSPPVA